MRYQWRTGTPPIATQMQYRYTGQRLEAGVGAPSPVGGLDRGLYFYGARWYDASLVRFLQPDTIVPNPGNPGSLNRYSYVLNNPLRYRDPSGHIPIDWLLDIGGIAFDIYQIIREPSRENWQILAVDVGLWALPYTPAVAGIALRSGKTAAQLAAHADEMVDAARLVNRAADATAGLRRFQEVGTEVVPDLLKAFGDGGRVVGEIPPALSGRGTRVIGRWWDTEVAEEFGGRIFTPAAGASWEETAKANYTWIQEAVKNGEVFYLASPVDAKHLLPENPTYKVAVFARELDALLQAGYRRVGDYLIPPH